MGPGTVRTAGMKVNWPVPHMARFRLENLTFKFTHAKIHEYSGGYVVIPR